MYWRRCPHHVGIELLADAEVLIGTSGSVDWKTCTRARCRLSKTHGDPVVVEGAVEPADVVRLWAGSL